MENEMVMIRRDTLEKTDTTWYYVEYWSTGDIHMHEMFKMNPNSVVWDYHVMTRLPGRLVNQFRKVIDVSIS